MEVKLRLRCDHPASVFTGSGTSCGVRHPEMLNLHADELNTEAEDVLRSLSKTSQN
jgi:hypothetical protein